MKILVVDDIKMCQECPCFNNISVANEHASGLIQFCAAKKAILKKWTKIDEITNEWTITNKPKWCPIRELPDYRTVSKELNWTLRKFMEQYAYGWNDCINEILGGIGGEICMADAENAEGSSSIPSAESGDSDQTAGQK